MLRRPLARAASTARAGLHTVDSLRLPRRAGGTGPARSGRGTADGLARLEGARPAPPWFATSLSELGAARLRPGDGRAWAVVGVTGSAPGDDVPPEIERLVRSGAVVVTDTATAARCARLPAVVGVGDAAQASAAVTGLLRHPHLRTRLVVPSRRALVEPSRSTVSAVVPTMRPDQLDHVLDTVGRQEHPHVQLVLVTHGFAVPTAELRRRAHDRGVIDVVAVEADAGLTLGACMNQGVAAADGEVVTKMDDDNFYAPHYLGDLLEAREHSGADVVGKWAHLTYLEASDLTVLRFPSAQFRYVPQVQGGTLLMGRAVARETGFEDLPRRVDTTFLAKVRAGGGRIYSADPFNFVSVRRADTAGHTWPITDWELLAKPSTLVCTGTPWAYATL